MANKNVQIKDMSGNLLFPKTLGKIVFNEAGQNLGTVEAGAQVNKLEKVQLNGTDIAINNKVANIVLPDAVVYSIAKAETAEAGFLATYNLTADGVATGASINIPKDFLVKSGEVKTVTEEGKPVAGYKVGDKYIDLVLNSKDGSATDEHMYILVSDLIDVYTEGNGIKIVGHAISIDDDVVVNHTEFATELAKKQDNLSEAQLAACDSGITEELVAKYDAYEAAIAEKVVKNADITAATKCKITYDAKGLVTGGADLVEGDLPAIHVAKIEDLTATAAEINVLDGIEASTAELNFVKGVTSGIQAQLDSKQGNLTDAQILAINSGITETKRSGYDTHVADTVKHITAEERTTWNAKQNALNADQLAAVNSGIDADKLATCLAKQDALNTNQLAAVNSGITETLVAKFNAYETGKADVATTLAGYGITDAIVFEELVEG